MNIGQPVVELHGMNDEADAELRRAAIFAGAPATPLLFPSCIYAPGSAGVRFEYSDSAHQW